MKAGRRVTGNPDVVTEIESRGYHFSMAEWDEDKAANILASAYDSGGSVMLEKAISFGPVTTAIQYAGNKKLTKIMRDNDFKALQLLDSNGVTFEAQEIAVSFGFLSWSFEEKEDGVVLELLGRLKEKELSKILNKNLYVIFGGKSPKLIKLALNNGVDPNAKIKTFNIDERNLIFLAIKTGVPEIVKLFLEADADLSVTYENKTPLDLKSFGIGISCNSF